MQRFQWQIPEVRIVDVSNLELEEIRGLDCRGKTSYLELRDEIGAESDGEVPNLDSNDEFGSLSGGASYDEVSDLESNDGNEVLNCGCYETCGGNMPCMGPNDKSKLRKREDSNLSPETPPNTNHNNNVIQPDVVVSANTSPVEPPPFLWLYSSKNNLAAPTSTTTSSQYTLYNNDQDVLVHGSSCEDTRKCNGSTGGGTQGLKKNLGGKWKKLVKKKASQEVYTIPAELKDQLKQIYVY